MTTRRKTSVDFRKDLEEIKKSEIALSNRVDKRIMEMARIHPEFVWNVNKNDPDPIRRNYILGGGFQLDKPDRYRTWISWWTLNQRLRLLEKIEKYSASKEKVEQLYLEIPDELKDTLKRLSD
jgi:hypothetical protein